MEEKHTIVLSVFVNDKLIVGRKAVADNLDIALLCAAAMGVRAIDAANEIGTVVEKMRDRYESDEPEE